MKNKIIVSLLSVMVLSGCSYIDTTQYIKEAKESAVVLLNVNDKTKKNLYYYRTGRISGATVDMKGASLDKDGNLITEEFTVNANYGGNSISIKVETENK